MHEGNKDFRDLTESELKKEIQKYSCIFKYHNKQNARAFLSYSITRYGRGFGGSGGFNALVAFPKYNDEINHSFFQLLHEYTHGFTDRLLKTKISMDDGSHDVTENLVILADYYFVKAIDKEDAPKYLNWISEKSGNVMTESEFLEEFKVDEQLDIELKNLINKILNFSEEKHDKS